MTAWYRAGTVTTVEGSATIVGSSTGWVAGGIQLGDIFTTDFVNLYEIQGITDDTHLTLDRGLTNAVGGVYYTVGGGSYAIIRNLSPPGASMMSSLIALTSSVDTLINETNAPYLGAAAAFTPSAQAAPNMTIQLASAVMVLGGVPSLVAAQSTPTLVAPVSHPRLDLVVVDIGTGVVSVIAGAEAASPVLAKLPAGKIPIAKLAMSVGMTAIGASQITDLRPIYDSGITNGSINVRQFGAIGDGVTLNGTAFTNAIAAATNAAQGAPYEILVPAGEYIIEITLTIPSNIRLRGVGSGVYGAVTSLKRNGNFTLLVSSNSGPTSPGFDLNESVFVEDLCLDGDNQTADLVQATACYEFKFARVWFNNCAGRALKTIELWDSRFFDCRFTFCGSQDGTLPAASFLSPGGASYDNTTNNIYFWGCRFESLPGVAVEFTGNNGVDLWFAHCKFECVSTQLDYLVRVSQATGVRFDSCWLYAAPTNLATKSWTDTATALTPTVGTISLTIATGDTFIYAAASTPAAPVGLSVLVYATGAPKTSWMTGRVNAYNSSTGALQIITDQATGSAQTGWTVVPCHPGLLYAHNSQSVGGKIIGGFQTGIPGSTTTYAKAFVHFDGCSSCTLDLEITQGTGTLIGNSLLAYHDTTTSGHVQSTANGGQSSFTIETGQSIATGSVLYISGNSAAYASDWMVGRVVSYTASTGALTVNVDAGGWGGVSSDTITSWLLVPSPANAALLTNVPATNPRVNITGNASPYGNQVSTLFSPTAYTLENLLIQGYHATLLSARNLTYQDHLYLEHEPDFTTPAGASTPAMTGKYQLYVYDYARANPYNILAIDGSRNLVLQAQNAAILVEGLLRWFDTTNGGSYEQTQIKGSIYGPGNLPVDGSGYVEGSVGDVYLNSALNSGSTAAGAPLVERFVCVAPYYTSGGTTTPATWMHSAPLQLSGPTASAPSSASGYAIGTYYEYTDPVAGGFEGQKVVSVGGTPTWKTVRPISS